ncbi:MAG: N-acetylmuramoyl-L-alanine amidase [Oscillospiraceae bacterium]|jgi:N-acetylmuramoyl-L-alanine amidase|nr:N-acetylmuramoyl-L-alanine amidase [Oscillospiraceae bacterium]
MKTHTNIHIRAFAILLVLALTLAGCGETKPEDSALPSVPVTDVRTSSAVTVTPSESPDEPERTDMPAPSVTTEDPEPSASASPDGAGQRDEQSPLRGLKLGIDAGHQGKGNSAQEPVAPGSSETKPKVTSGTQGRVTRVPEHEVNLSVALLLEEKLLSLGAEVVMVRRTADVDVSNVERATMMNEAGVDLVIRIHADGSEDTGVSGASMHVPDSQITAAVNDASRAAGEVIFKDFILVTGAKDQGVIGRRDLSGFNWSTVPAVLIELGFMTNEEEDKKLTTPEYQELCAEGLARGVVSWSNTLKTIWTGADGSGDNQAEDLSADTAEKIQAAVDAASRKYGAVGVQVAVVSGGRIAGTFVYGDATKGTRAMDPNIKMRVASISKVVLAMTAMKLRERGALDIDADIGDYWGASIRNPNHTDIPITIRQIMSHTSSILVYDYGFEAGGELVRSRLLNGSCFGKNTPGAISSWAYNNYGFATLGVTIETAVGETVNSIAARELFAPLGIDAAFGSGSISDTESLATLYWEGGSVGRSVEEQKKTLGSTFPGERGEEFPGGLTISAHDLAKLISVLVNDGIYGEVSVMSRESVALMESSHGKPDGVFEQCLPLLRRTNLYGEPELYYHTGSNYGVYNLISYNPISKNGVVVLTSGASGSRDANGIYAICGEISKAVYGLIAAQ